MKCLWIGAALAVSLAAAGTARAASVTVFVNGDGGRLTAGPDAAGRDRSGIVASSGRRALEVPAYAGSAAAWGRLLGCVQTQFRDFDVDIVDTRPAGGDYVMAMVGGRPQMLGYPDGIGGIGPFTGGVVHGGIVFAFEKGHPSERALCETTAHEIGHALGLDHSRRCDDIMSYGQCGPKAFREEEAACGEFSDRVCHGGAKTQSSRAVLARTVGLRREPAPARPQPIPPRPTPRAPAVDRPAPASGVAIRSSRAHANGAFVVEVRARDPEGIRHVDLVWAQPGHTRRLRCGESDPSLPYTCVRRGDRYVFTLAVGAGVRRYAVRVTDGAGHVTVTPTSRREFR